MLAAATTLVVVNHDSRTNGRKVRRHAGPNSRNHTAWLMAGDDMSSWVRSDGAVVLQVAATHARGFHGDDHLARPRRGIRKVLEREFSIPEKDDAAHGFTLVSDSPTSEP
jgi:hypothetical protein